MNQKTAKRLRRIAKSKAEAKLIKKGFKKYSKQQQKAVIDEIKLLEQQDGNRQRSKRVSKTELD